MHAVLNTIDSSSQPRPLQHIRYKLDAKVEKWIQFVNGFSTPALHLAQQAICDAANLLFEGALRHVEEVYLN